MSGHSWANLGLQGSSMMLRDANGHVLGALGATVVPGFLGSVSCCDHEGRETTPSDWHAAQVYRPRELRCLKTGQHENAGGSHGEATTANEKLTHDRS